MSRSKVIAIVFYLGAVVIGGAAGIALDRTVVRDWMERDTEDRRTRRDRIASYLSLTPTQLAAFDSIFGAAQKSDSVLFAPVYAQMTPLMPQRDSIFSTAGAQFRVLLNPEQQELYDKRQQQNRRPRSNDSRR